VRSGLHAGFWIGQRDAVCELLDLLELGRRHVRSEECSFVDQMLANGRERVAVDSAAVLCQSLKDVLSELAYDGVRRRVYDRRTGTYPCVVHGRGRADMSPIFKWLKLQPVHHLRQESGKPGEKGKPAAPRGAVREVDRLPAAGNERTL